MVVNDYRSDLDPYSYSWDAYVERQIGHKTARELQEYQAKLYVGAHKLSLGAFRGRSLLEELLYESKMEKRHSARVRQSLRATSPAATAEQAWAGYVVKVLPRAVEEPSDIEKIYSAYGRRSK